MLNARPLFEDTRWPLVTVHVISDGSRERGIGEPYLVDAFTHRWMLRRTRTAAQGKTSSYYVAPMP